ncbi:hypothetical protein OAJ42_01095 [Flavobacteriales bacterium]|nr:hypothetical protein [Flavobacteriales bacterium]
MAMFGVRKIVCGFFIFSSLVISQENNSLNQWRKEIRKELKEVSDKKDRKLVNQFIKTISSSNISNDEKEHVLQVLNAFAQRGLQFNTYYIYFFDLFLSIDKNIDYKNINTQFLNYLSLNKDFYSNLELKKFLVKCKYLFDSNILNKTQYFTWQIDGGCSIDFNQSKKPVFYFPSATLLLCNNYDTIQINNVSGGYNVLDDVFEGLNGDVVNNNDDVNFNIFFDNFSLDLNKKFFQIPNSTFVSKSNFYGTSIGTYKDKLGQRDNYPRFKSDSNDENFELFEGMSIKSGVEVQGGSAFFYQINAYSTLNFIDDSLNYVVSASRFQLLPNKLLASNAEFSISNANGSLSHPFVKFVYNNENKTILIDRLSGTRGLNPIRNLFHGLNMYVDRLEIDLIYDHCLLFHYVQANDPRVLIESDTYFDRSRYQDLLKFDINPIMLLKDFMETRELGIMYSVAEFAAHSKIDINTILSIILDLEIFGFLKYDSSVDKFIVNSWYLDFLNSEKREYDYDCLKIESLAGVRDTIASIDLILNEMDLFGVQKINLTNRFDISVMPKMNKLKFIGNKNFLIDGDIYLGNFAFSGIDIMFNYHNFSFDFGPKSLLSFIDNINNQQSSSFIHFDRAHLYLDTLDNKSGIDLLNDYPKFSTIGSSYLSYNDNPVNFSIQPFDINYLTDLSLDNIRFLGDLHLDGVTTNLNATLLLDDSNNLSTSILTDSLIYFYKGMVDFKGSLSLSHLGLFADGNFQSDNFSFNSDSMEIKSGNMIGSVSSLKSSLGFSETPFSLFNGFLSYFPYENTFLIKGPLEKIKIYSEFDFDGDLYFDGDNLNGSGRFLSKNINIDASHHYFSKDNIMSADATLSISTPFSSNVYLQSNALTIEQDLLRDSVYVYKSNYAFELPEIDHVVDFDFFVYDLNEQSIYFQNNDPYTDGKLTNTKYAKNGFDYNALEANYDLTQNQFCVYSVFPLRLKKFLLQPELNQFCITSGDFLIFENATLIKERKLFKDKLLNYLDVKIRPSLKIDIIND